MDERQDRVLEIQREIFGHKVIEPWVTHLLIACDRIAALEAERDELKLRVKSKDAIIAAVVAADQKQEVVLIEQDATITELRALLEPITKLNVSSMAGRDPSQVFLWKPSANYGQDPAGIPLQWVLDVQAALADKEENDANR